MNLSRSPDVLDYLALSGLSGILLGSIYRDSDLLASHNVACSKCLSASCVLFIGLMFPIYELSTPQDTDVQDLLLYLVC